jgi:hypothetical protein
MFLQMSLSALLATGNLVNVASWSNLRKDEALWFNAFLSFLSISGAMPSLEQADIQLSANHDLSSHGMKSCGTRRNKLALRNVALRIAVSFAVAALVFKALRTECPEITPDQSWQCAVLRHHLLEDPHCNCRALSFKQQDSSSSCSMSNLNYEFCGSVCQHCGVRIAFWMRWL